MTRTRVIAIGGALVLLLASGIAFDALTVTDEERVELLTDDVAGVLTRSRVDSGLARWVDLSRQPFEVSALGESQLYEAGDDDALRARAERALSGTYGSRVRVLASNVELEGERAILSVRVVVAGQGMSQLEWTLEKHGDDWLLERLAVRR